MFGLLSNVSHRTKIFLFCLWRCKNENMVEVGLQKHNWSHTWFLSFHSAVKFNTSWTRWFPQSGSTSAPSATSSSTTSPRWSAWTCLRTCAGSGASSLGMWKNCGTSTASTSWRSWRRAPTRRCPSAAASWDTWVPEKPLLSWDQIKPDNRDLMRLKPFS